MIDVITYTNHTTGLQSKLANNKHLFKQIMESDDGQFWINWNSVPVKQIGENSVSLIRVNDLSLVEAIGFEILAQCETGTGEAFDLVTEAGQAKIELAYDRTPIPDGEGGTYTPPYNFGVFA